MQHSSLEYNQADASSAFPCMLHSTQFHAEDIHKQLLLDLLPIQRHLITFTLFHQKAARIIMDLRTTYLFNLTFLRSKMPPKEEPLRSIQLKKNSSIFSCYYCPHSTASVFSRKFEKIPGRGPTLRGTKCHLWQSTRVAEKQLTTTATLRSLNYLSTNIHDRSSTDAVYLDVRLLIVYLMSPQLACCYIYSVYSSSYLLLDYVSSFKPRIYSADKISFFYIGM